MQSNPIMERVVRLSEQWYSLVKDNPELRVICWGGSSFTEYKLIKGFIMFQMSEEATLDDIFIYCGQPFDADSVFHYGDITGALLNEYVNAWNDDANVVAKGGKVDWHYEPAEEEEDIPNFVENINSLADYLIPEGTGPHLVIAIMPGVIRNFNQYLSWMKCLLSLSVSPKVRYMLYDRIDARLLDRLVKVSPVKFKYVIPDVDMGGAINEVLENAKHERESVEDKDAITFQQHLVYLTQAIAEGDASVAEKHRISALHIAEDRHWPDLQAVVHYFMYSLYMAKKENQRAEDAINLAISLVGEAMQAERAKHLLSYCEYQIGKAMLFLRQEKYAKATGAYDETIPVAMELDNPVLLISLYQMKGICLRLSDNMPEAWDCFASGWTFVEDRGEELMTHLMYRYYAKEMLKVKADRSAKRDYECRFDELWGRDWSDELDLDLKKNKQEYKIFNT